MTTGSRTLVLGAWSSLPPRQLEPFVRSLRATGFAGAFCLVLGRHEPSDREAFGRLADLVLDAGAGETLRALAAALGMVEEDRSRRSDA